MNSLRVLFGRPNRTTPPDLREFLEVDDAVRKLKPGHNHKLGKGSVIQHPSAGLYEVMSDGELVATHTHSGSAALQAHRIARDRVHAPASPPTPRRFDPHSRHSS